MSKPRSFVQTVAVRMKIDYGVDDPAFVDAVFGGAVNEAHTCPECGRTELRTG